jgi:hypothetical protein
MVVARSTHQGVGVRGAIEGVAAATTVQVVRAGATGEQVRVLAAGQDVALGAAAELVRAAEAPEVVCRVRAAEGVTLGAAHGELMIRHAREGGRELLALGSLRCRLGSAVQQSFRHFEQVFRHAAILRFALGPREMDALPGPCAWQAENTARSTSVGPDSMTKCVSMAPPNCFGSTPPASLGGASGSLHPVPTRRHQEPGTRAPAPGLMCRKAGGARLS